MKLLQVKLSAALAWQLTRFALVGLAATLTHYTVAIVGVEQWQWPLYMANIGGYLTAVAVSFIGHAKYTFRVKASLAVFSRFVAVSLSALALSELLLLMLESGLHLPYRVSMLAVVTTIPVFTFVVSRLWVYRPSKK